jgi:hypothetical protein
MERYVIPRSRRRHLVVSDSVHEEVMTYATWRQLSLVEATYRLLRPAFVQEYDSPIPKKEEVRLWLTLKS